LTEYEIKEVIRKAKLLEPLDKPTAEKLELWNKHKLRFKHLPLDTIRITSPYGKRPPVTVNGVTKDKFHNGIDFGAKIPGKVGDPIYSVDDGIMRYVGFNADGYGKYTVIEHNGYCTFYAHLGIQELLINKSVKAGDLIGIMGSTGFSEKAHLHFGMCIGSYKKGFWENDATGKQVNGIDPTPLIKELIERQGKTHG